jgi:hypothetical protein
LRRISRRNLRGAEINKKICDSWFRRKYDNKIIVQPLYCNKYTLNCNFPAKYWFHTVGSQSGGIRGFITRSIVIGSLEAATEAKIAKNIFIQGIPKKKQATFFDNHKLP